MKWTNIKFLHVCATKQLYIHSHRDTHIHTNGLNCTITIFFLFRRTLVPVSEPAEEFVGTALVTLLPNYGPEWGWLILIDPEQMIQFTFPAAVGHIPGAAVLRELLSHLLLEVQASVQHTWFLCFLVGWFHRAALLGSQSALLGFWLLPSWTAFSFPLAIFSRCSLQFGLFSLHLKK